MSVAEAAGLNRSQEVPALTQNGFAMLFVSLLLLRLLSGASLPTLAVTRLERFRAG